MNAETIVTMPRDKREVVPEHTSYIAEGRVVHATSASGELRCGWQTTNGALACRWSWVALRGEDDADSIDVAA